MPGTTCRDVARVFTPEQCREPLLPNELPSRPRKKIGADLFELNGHSFIIMVDYWSNLKLQC